MKTFLKALVLATALSTLGVVAAGQANAADPVCIIATKSEFLERVGPKSRSIKPVPNELFTKFISAVNLSRTKNGAPPMVADEMYIGLLVNGNIGIVMFFKDCVVPGTVVAMKPDDIRAVFKQFGVEEMMSLTGFEA